MLYGVCLVVKPDKNGYSKMGMKLWRSKDANLLIRIGSEAVFIDEMSARNYACEQSNMRGIEFDSNAYDVD